MKVLALTLALVLGAWPTIAAPAVPTSAGATQRGYVLTMDLVKRWSDSVKAMKAAQAKDPSIKTEAGQMQGEGEQTPEQAIARLREHPRIYAFFKANGLSETDSVMVGVVVIEAAFASGERDLSGFPNVSPAQVAFMKAHDAELRAMLKGVFTEEP